MARKRRLQAIPSQALTKRPVFAIDRANGCAGQECDGALFWRDGAHVTVLQITVLQMKIKNSIKSLKARHRANRMVRRRGRVYVINKTNPRFKARQG